MVHPLSHGPPLAKFLTQLSWQRNPISVKMTFFFLQMLNIKHTLLQALACSSLNFSLNSTPFCIGYYKNVYVLGAASVFVIVAQSR